MIPSLLRVLFWLPSKLQPFICFLFSSPGSLLSPGGGGALRNIFLTVNVKKLKTFIKNAAASHQDGGVQDVQDAGSYPPKRHFS